MSRTQWFIVVLVLVGVLAIAYFALGERQVAGDPEPLPPAQEETQEETEQQ